MIRRTLRLWHTVRYLRPIQIFGRIWFRLYRPRPDLRPAPALRAVTGGWPAMALRDPSMSGPTRLRFLDEEHDLSELNGWDDTRVARLWRYNLHYFDDLCAEGAPDRRAWHRALIEHWIKDNPPGLGSGWEPYPASLRIVNWIGFSLAGGKLPNGAVQSLAVQARWLRKRLEHHLLGNHLWANAKALVFAGTWFDGREARSWQEMGLRLLQRELTEQVLADGGHFERSPMYHAVILADLLELCALTRALPSALPSLSVRAWEDAASRMLDWLAVMTRPDGDIVPFNDAASGIAPSLVRLKAFAETIGIRGRLRDAGVNGSVDLPETGYARLHKGPAIIWADAAPIGPDYIPGHAHADTLTFEMSVHGQPVFVDAGISRYDISPERLQERSTAAHNTVEIDDQDSSEVWGSFRVARRARVFDRRLHEEDEQITLECAHDGYRRLPGRPVHRRRWVLSPRRLLLTDCIEGRFQRAVSRLHLHPAIRPDITDPGRGTLTLPDGRQLRWQVRGARMRIAASLYHPRFNTSIDNQCIELQLDGANCEVEVDWD